MSAPLIGHVAVIGIQRLTPRMRRIQLCGDVLAHYPPDCEGAHIKLLFPLAHQAHPTLPTLGDHGPAWPDPCTRPWSRTYTVATINREQRTLGVDMVLHGDGGPGSRWATQAQLGQSIGLIGPGGPPLYRADAGRFLLVGDPSSLPLLRAVMSRLPSDARGDVLIEIADPDDRQPLPERPHMQVHWHLRRGKQAGESPLLQAVRALDRPEFAVSVTLAGESSQVVAIRHHLREAWQVPKAMMYAVPYWKARLDEDAYHDDRHRIMDAFDAEAA